MKQKKVGFFKRVKKAITNFDEYKIFAEEKVSVSIKYLLKLMFIFVILITIGITIRLTNEANKAIQIFREECPDFKFEDNNLIIESDNKHFIKGDEYGFFGLIIDSENNSLTDVENANEYQRVIAILKDKLVIKSVDNVESSITYEQLSQEYDINNVNKQTILNFLSSENMTKLYMIFVVLSIIYLFIIYVIQVILDVLLLSVIGFLLSKIIGIEFKYKSIFNMSVYSLTLSIVLYMIYIIVNLFTGFEIKYFTIAYNAIAYIYIITAMLMIKSDLIKTQGELTKIVQEQKKIREEKQKEDNKEEKEDKREQKKDKKQKENKDDKGEEQTPEGSKA